LLHKPLGSTIGGSLWHRLEKFIRGSLKLVGLVGWELLGLSNKAHVSPGHADTLPMRRRKEMYARRLLAADDDNSVLGEEEQRERLERNPSEAADDIAPRRELKLRVAALRRFRKKSVATPLNNFAAAVSNGHEPNTVTDFARILFVVNPHIESRQSHTILHLVIWPYRSPYSWAKPTDSCHITGNSRRQSVR
jgi:hypothetical protein